MWEAGIRLLRSLFVYLYLVPWATAPLVPPSLWLCNAFPLLYHPSALTEHSLLSERCKKREQQFANLCTRITQGNSCIANVYSLYFSMVPPSNDDYSQTQAVSSQWSFSAILPNSSVFRASVTRMLPVFSKLGVITMVFFKNFFLQIHRYIFCIIMHPCPPAPQSALQILVSVSLLL